LLWIALYNLLENGVKFSFREATIRLEIDDGAPSCWSLRIRNTGTLASQEDKGIFEPFIRTAKKIEPWRRGDGSGLVVCATILRAHDPESGV
jgi:K+-sensing histidine kinase KdpD